MYFKQREYREYWEYCHGNKDDKSSACERRAELEQPQIRRKMNEAAGMKNIRENMEFLTTASSPAAEQTLTFNQGNPLLIL